MNSFYDSRSHKDKKIKEYDTDIKEKADNNFLLDEGNHRDGHFSFN
jgi:hypothetical protein